MHGYNGFYASDMRLSITHMDTKISPQPKLIIEQRNLPGVTMMRVSPSVMFPAHASLEMRVSPHTYH